MMRSTLGMYGKGNMHEDAKLAAPEPHEPRSFGGSALGRARGAK